MLNSKKIVLWTGLGYLLIFITGFFSNFFVLESNFFMGDAGATIEAISANEQLFRIGIAAFVIMVITDVILALPLYYLFRDVNPVLAMLSSVLRVVNGSLFAVALFFLVKIMVNIPIYPVSGAENVLDEFEAFDLMWKVGLIFFGIHLFILAHLMLKKANFPKLIGGSMMLAGLGYLIDSFAMIILMNYEEHASIFEMIVLIPAVIGELSFTVFLLIKGIKGNELIRPELF